VRRAIALCVLLGCAESPALQSAQVRAPHHITIENHEAVAAMPLWLFVATERANRPHPRPRLSHTVSLGYVGDAPLTGALMRDTPVPTLVDEEGQPFQEDMDEQQPQYWPYCGCCWQ